MKRVGSITVLKECLGLLFLFLMLQTAYAAEEKLSIGEVVVTASRYEEKVTDIPANITVITGDSIRNSSAHNIPELLRTEAGVHVSDINGARRTYTVDLRGFGETSALNTLVLVDGRRVNQPDLSGADWANIPLERVKKIEVIRGGRGSVIYGDNATGGAINIITREGEGFKADVDLLAGSYATFRTAAAVSGGKENMSFHLSGNYLGTEGFRDNSKSNSADVGLNTAYYVKDYLKINFSGGYHKDKTGLPGALKESDFAAGASRTDTKFPSDYAKTEDYYLKVTPEVYFAGDSSFKVDASYRKRSFVSFTSGDWGNFLGDSSIATVAISPQIIFKKSFGAASNSLTAGIDYQKADNDILNDSLFFGFRSIGNFTLTKENQGYYIHDEITLANNIRISGGYRYDKAEFTFHPSTPDSISMSRSAGTAGVNYTFYRKSYVYASYAKSFRYPVLDELYSFYTNTVNTSLLPQTSDNVEAGVRHYITDDFYMHLNGFRMDTRREIIYNPLTYMNENLDGKTRRDGVEVSAYSKITDKISARASYTYLNARIRDGFYSGKEIPNVPMHKATAEVVAGLGKGFTAALNSIYVGERPFISDFSNNFSKQKQYALLNAKLAYEKKGLRAFIEINNLTNKSYSEYGVIGGFPQEKAYYPSPGRNFAAGLSISF